MSYEVKQSMKYLRFYNGSSRNVFGKGRQLGPLYGKRGYKFNANCSPHDGSNPASFIAYVTERNSFF